MKSKLTARELSNFCGQMGILLHSGISTAEGLHILCDESKTDADRQILTPLIRSVEENGSLSRALDESGIFPTSMTAYVRTGEETGCLDEIMESLSSHYEQEEEIRKCIQPEFSQLKQMGEKHIFERIDLSVFRKDVDLELMYQEILWTTEGYLCWRYRMQDVDAEEIEKDFLRLIKQWRRIYYKAL